MSQDHYLHSELHEKLRLDDSLFRFFADGSLDGIWYWDLENPEHEWLSPKFWTLLGYDPATRQHLASEWQSLIDPDDLATAVDNFKAHCADPSHPYDQIVRYRHREGHTIWVRCRGLAIRDDQGRAIRMFGAHTDITPLKRAEEDLMRRTFDLEQALGATSAAEARFRVSFHNAPIGMALVSLEGRFLDVNRALCSFLQRSEAELKALDFQSISHPEDCVADLELFEQALAGVRSTYQVEKRYLRPDGSAVWALLAASVARDSDGEPSHFVAHVKDIHNRRMANLATTARLRAAFDDSFVGAALVIVEPERPGLVTQANEAFAELCGQDCHQVAGSQIGELLDLASAPDLVRMLSNVGPKVERLEAECRLRCVTTPERWVRVLAALVAGTMEGQRYAVLQFEDITERREAQRILQHRSSHDDLTDLPNRALAIDRLQQALARSVRSEQHVLAVFIDLDHFKSINDTLGHVIGDKLLVWFAQQIRSVLRPADTAARLGGDEFVLICEGLSTVHEEAVAEMNTIVARVRAATAQDFECEGSQVAVTASIGMRLAQGAGNDAESVLREADAAMYQAKNSGRARAHVYDDGIRAEAVQRLQIQSSLRDSLDRGEFSVAYQPIVRLSDGAVTGAEALARWQHPEHGAIPPDRFIRVAEDSGLVVKLGEQILAQVCDAVARHRRWHTSRLTIAVNVSARQLTQSDFVATFRRHLERCGIPPSKVAIELTESVLTNVEGSSVRQLHQLRKMGTAVGIDDFGTGYSSLAYLRRLPISFVKLDRTFVAGIGKNAADGDIVRAIVSLARALKLDVIAEGVERKDQIRALATMGCRTGQGFYFGRPGTAESIDKALRAVGGAMRDSGSGFEASQN